jgi:hypothetical protein
MRTLTGMGGLGNAQELAELLRQMGRGPDSMLAHITPEEAQMLLESGGSGRMNPMTGLPEFQPEDYNFEVDDQYDIGFGPGRFTPEVQPADIQGMAPEQFERFTGQQPMFTGEGSLAPPNFQPFQYGPANMAESFQPEFDIGFGPGQFQPAMPQTQGLELSPTRGVRGMAPDQFQRFTADDQAQPAGMGDRLRGLESKYGEFTQNYPMLSRLLTTGASSLPAILAARSARREGGAAADELRALGAPLREQAEALRQQALTGGLTPQQARQQEARRASMRQAASTRGATSGTQQAMIENTLARERAGLSETNLNNAIKQLNLANAYDEAAIRARLQSDTQTANVLANILGNLAQATAGTSIPNQSQQNNQNRQTSQLTSSMPAEAVTRRAEVK